MKNRSLRGRTTDGQAVARDADATEEAVGDHQGETLTPSAAPGPLLLRILHSAWRRMRSRVRVPAAGEKPVITYALWVHPLLGLFAIRRESGTVTGVRSVPLYAANELNLERLPYDTSEAAIHRARDTPEQFVPFAAWQQGRVVPVRRRPRHSWLRRS
jgi:hypothetical protein